MHSSRGGEEEAVAGAATTTTTTTTTTTDQPLQQQSTHSSMRMMNPGGGGPPPPQQQQQIPPCCRQQQQQHHHPQFSNVFLVGYLGSAILTKGKTGLGCLQQPLRELYYIYRQNGARLLQERRVFISMDGITMIYNEYGVEKFLHNDLGSVYDIQLLQLICEHRQKDNKKLHCAFLPIGKHFCCCCCCKNVNWGKVSKMLILSIKI